MKLCKSQENQNKAKEIRKYVNDQIEDFYITSKECIQKLIINISPKEILKLSSSSTFGRLELEISANWILNFLADRDNTFLPFDLKDLQSYYEKELGIKEKFWFNGLENGNKTKNIIPEIKRKGGKIYLSQRFIIFASINHKELYLNN